MIKDALNANNTWEILKLFKGIIQIACKWVLLKKKVFHGRGVNNAFLQQVQHC